MYSVLGLRRVRYMHFHSPQSLSSSQAIDYQSFASENAEKLARAIESGIPSNLRGMVWQLM